MSSITVTPSTIAWLMGCHHKFERLAERRQYPDVKGTQPFLRYGNAVHEVLARLYTQPQGAHDLQDLSAHLSGAFCRQPYSDEKERQHDIARASGMIRLYLDQMDDDPCTIVGVERSANFPVKVDGKVAFRIAARHDLLLVREDEPEVLIVRDWKISGGVKALSSEQQWINLAAAKWAFPDVKSLRLEIDALNSDSGVDRVVYKSSDLKGVVSLVTDRVMEYLRATDHPPTPGPECRWCPLRDECEAKIAVDWRRLDLG